MKKLLTLLGVLPFAAAMAVSCSDDQVFDLTIHSICDIVVNPETVSMVIEEAETGGIIPAQESGDMTLFSNATGLRVDVQMDQVMPAGTSLTILGAVPQGTFLPVIFTHSVASGTLVIDLDYPSFSGAHMIFTFDAEATVPPGTFARTVTYTMTDS